MMLSQAENLQHWLWGRIGWIKYQLLEHRRSEFIRWSLVIACIALSLVSGALMTRSPLLGFGAVVAVGGLAALFFVYNNLETTCLLLLVVTTVFNFGVGTGTGTPIMLTVVILVLVLLVWLFKLLLVERSFASIRAATPNRLVVLFCVSVTISLIWSTFYVEGPVRPMLEDKLNPRLMTSLIIMLSPISMLMIANHLRSMRAIKFFVWWMIGFGAVAMVLWIANLNLPPIINIRGQIGLWASMLALGQALYNDKLRLSWRGALLIIPAGWWYAQYGLGISWLSGWLPLALGFAAFTFIYSRKVFAVFVIVGIVFALTNMDKFSVLLEEENSESGGTRVEAWDRTLRIVGDHYLFGSGPAGYYFYLQIYVGGFFQLSHNNYVDVLAQMGIVGIVIYLLLWIAIGLMLLRTFLKAPPTGFLRGLATALGISYCLTLVLMMLGDWVIPFPYTQTLAGISYTIWPWLLAGLGISIYHYMLENEQQPVEVVAETNGEAHAA